MQTKDKNPSNTDWSRFFSWIYRVDYRVSKKKLSLVENSRGKYNSCGWEIQWEFLINPDCCVAF